MRKLLCLSIFILFSLFLASTVSAQCQGNIYITSLSWQTANSVHGFTSTELDYCAGLYYDPANLGNFIENYHTGFALIGESYAQGYADSVPASLNFDFFAPVHNVNYSTNGNHYVIAYYLVYVPYWNNYYWYDPWNLGLAEIGGGYEQAPDYFGYFSYVTYWVSSPQFVGSTVHTITYNGQTQCLPGQQFTTTGQACSSLPQCQPGQQFTTTGETCPNYIPPPEPPAQPAVTVQVLNQPLYPAGLPAVLSVPQKSKNTSTLTCIVGVANPSGRPVTLQVVNDSFNSGLDGGHKENFHIGPRPLGNLGKSTGVTGADGCFRTTYTPPHISGKFKLKASISGIPSETDIWVYVPELVPLRAGENYRLNGGIIDCNVPDSSCTPTIERQAHPDNHWIVPEAKPALIKVANDYKGRFYGNGQIPVLDMITYNDASLEWGGKFDLKRNWSSANSLHGEHREGLSIDTRSNNLHGRDEAFIQIFFANNFGFNDERTGEAPHFHLRWADLRRTGSSGVLQNGIDQNAFGYDKILTTPSSLVSLVGEAILERQITQEEFESWYPQLSNAKSQGSNTFLQEVKTFEKQLFASQEYIARQRTNEQFVNDVFASHLFREPTTEELSFWVSYLSNIGGTQPIESTDPEPSRTRTAITMSQTQRRQIFLNNFQTLPDFANIIGSISDDAYPEPPH